MSPTSNIHLCDLDILVESRSPPYYASIFLDNTHPK